MIELRALSAGYDGKFMLHDIFLTFPEGKITALLGPNGSGKSTLLRAALGLQKKNSGEILYDGMPIEALSARQIACRAAYLAQSRSTPNITAQRMVLHGRFPHLSFPRRYRGEDYEIARQALLETDALAFAARPMTKLSGGQRQKVYLAMTLAQDTKTVFMDEPTTYLDIRHQLDMMDLARRLAAEGRAVVLVLHDLCLALQRADRVAILCDGVLQAVGTPEEIYRSGVLKSAFGVGMRCVKDETGSHYYYESR